MKETGIIRRIDDLGRVVIPKEIRRTLRIKEGDALELFLNGADGVLFKKYSPLKVLSGSIDGYAESIVESIGHIACITDNDNIVSVSGIVKSELMHKRISQDVENAINNNTVLIKNAKSNEQMIDITDEKGNPYGYCSCIIVPIIVLGDKIGAVIILTKDKEAELGEIEIKFAKAIAKFIEKQMAC
ncbi:MAG: stage sporulation protein [Clostridiaceae bacterium]|nr:stage sporulation protein [Clostridiaceae bacterium]